MSSTLLSGENINYISEQLFTVLTQQGIEYNIKENESKIRNYLAKLIKQWPNEGVEKINQYAVNQLYSWFLQNARGSHSGHHSVKDEFEKMRAARDYQVSGPPQGGPPTPDFSAPIMPGTNAPPPGHISLSHARGLNSISTRPGRSSAVEPEPSEESVSMAPPPAVSIPERQPSPVPKRTYVPSGSEKWISLGKNDLINQTNNSFTFSWKKSALAESENGCFLQLKYVTLPKYFPWLLIEFSGNEENNVYSSSGSHYGSKLVPFHTSGEYTTYQALGTHLQFKQIPNCFSIKIIPPNNGLDLGSLAVQKVTKQNKKIHVTTKFPHNLQPSDSLTLEFPNNFSCYKISNLQIINSHQFQIDSPFVGYFNSNFRLLRNNWTLDLTLVCQAV